MYLRVLNNIVDKNKQITKQATRLKMFTWQLKMYIN